MKCPKCGGRTRAYDTRWWNILDISGVNIRRRECIDCKCRFVTCERFIRVTEGRKHG
jgi:transcriptional regulator NrdR family protein